MDDVETRSPHKTIASSDFPTTPIPPLHRIARRCVAGTRVQPPVFGACLRMFQTLEISHKCSINQYRSFARCARQPVLAKFREFTGLIDVVRDFPDAYMRVYKCMQRIRKNFGGDASLSAVQGDLITLIRFALSIMTSTNNTNERAV